MRVGGVDHGFERFVMTQKVKDRRGKPRIETHLEARITADDKPQVAVVKNISMSGLLLIVDQPVKELTLVGLRLVLPSGGEASAERHPTYAFELSGAVVRCSAAGPDHPNKHEVAVFLTGMPKETRLALQDFIKDRIRYR